MTPHQHAASAPSDGNATEPLVLSLADIDAGAISLAGGKAANLGELRRAGFALPDGFCVTSAAYALTSQTAGLEPVLAALAATSAADVSRLHALAQAARDALLAVELPVEVAAAIGTALRHLDDGESAPVAVRSSATAEDLPWASFAGQQESYLHVRSVAAVLDAVRRCFASLWTDRAVTYRANLGLDPRTVRIAVVVQRLIDAAVAGALFTANPLTGKRREAVIEANPGLGEAVVSGATTPDHFVVNVATGQILERRLSQTQVIVRPSPSGGIEQQPPASTALDDRLSDDQIRSLARLSAQVEAHFGRPQDLEWALDSVGKIWLLQARAITTLYPLPAAAPATDDELRVYLCFGAQQGITRPFTPMGDSAVRLLASGLTTLMGLPPSNPLEGPRFVVTAGSRLFLDLTRALRSGFGRQLLTQMMAEAEVQVAAGLAVVENDPRLSLLPTRRWRVVRAAALLFVRTGLPWYLAQALLFPRRAQARVRRLLTRARRAQPLPPSTDAAAQLRAAKRLLLRDAPRQLPRISPVMVAGMQAFSLARRLLGAAATVEMNLALWSLGQRLASDAESATLLRSTAPGDLATRYRAGQLPRPVQHGLATFLAQWGQLAVAELDLGLPRWSEDPAAVFGLLAGYLASADQVAAPQRQVERMAHDARAMIRTLTRRIPARKWLRRWLVGLLLRRAHFLAGYREVPRLGAALLLARTRTHLSGVGKALAQRGRLAQPDDIFFLSLPEVQRALSKADRHDWQQLVRERRASYGEELARRRVPLLLLSDGAEPAAARADTADAAPTQGVLRGTAASPGVVSGVARVIRDPAGARLEPGEILVAPSTDPGWTPLFLTAGGLVMELGGAMAHGAIVAREYGLPAVVGVPQATERIQTGQRITVDGSASTITVQPAAAEEE